MAESLSGGRRQTTGPLAKRKSGRRKSLRRDVTAGRAALSPRINGLVLTSLPFFHSLEVQWPSGRRYIYCRKCRQSFKRSIVPHLLGKHSREWNRALDDWLTLRKSGLTYKSITKAYTSQKGEYIFSWNVVKRHVKTRIERTGQVIMVKSRTGPYLPGPLKEIRPRTSVWSFPKRGDWSVHASDYEGNWSPFVPHEIIRSFSKKGQLVLDPFVGGGTTLVECVLLERRGLGLDVNPVAVKLARQKVAKARQLASKGSKKALLPTVVTVQNGDARYLTSVPTGSVDLVCTHPPYGQAIRYTNSLEDLSRLAPDEFVISIGHVAKELYRVLKPGKFCAILMGDYRHRGVLYPNGLRVLEELIDGAGFELQDVIVKLQHQDSSTGFYPGRTDSLRYRIAHEYLFVVRKPGGETSERL